MNKKNVVILVGILLAFIFFIYPAIYSHDNKDYNIYASKYAPGKFVSVNDKKMHYVEKGQGDVVICIHGFLYNTTMWKKNIDALSEKFHVYAIDLFGWGFSERLKSDSYSFELYKNQIIGFMDALGIKKAHLIGQSMGGGISVMVAANHPERVNKIILVDPVVLPYEFSFEAKVYAVSFVGEFLNSLPTLALYKSLLKTLWFYDPEKVTDEYANEVLLPIRIRGTYDGAMHIHRNVLRGKMLEDEAKMLSQHNKRILLLHGENDAAVKLERSQKLHEMWNTSRLEVWEKAAHSPHEEYPEKFNELALEFLKDDENVATQ